MYLSSDLDSTPTFIRFSDTIAGCKIKRLVKLSSINDIEIRTDRDGQPVLIVSTEGTDAAQKTPFCIVGREAKALLSILDFQDLETLGEF